VSGRQDVASKQVSDSPSLGETVDGPHRGPRAAAAYQHRCHPGIALVAEHQSLVAQSREPFGHETLVTNGLVAGLPMTNATSTLRQMPVCGRALIPKSLLR